jgi:predicted AlkP superfamily phosphohydrolase/phosphomutase
VWAACGSRPPAHYPSVIVLGIDGMDPAFLEAHWTDLPNLDRLRREGEFQRLATTMPPQSPVAWSTFITGTSPERHGIYDFVHRNPRTLLPFSSLGETDAARGISIGGWRIPLGSPRVHSFRRGAAFWEALKLRGIPVTLVKVPMDYPPAGDADEALSGLGVPDMQGTFGTFTFFTDDPLETARDVPGGRIAIVHVENRRATLRVMGPPNPFRSDARPAWVDIAADLDPTQPIARFTMAHQAFILREGEWSDWIEADFPLLWPFSARGMFRVYAKRLRDGLGVYVSPVNIDPAKPEAKISAPSSYSAQLARATGLYYTQGFPQDTAALRQHVFDRTEYLTQSRTASREQLALLMTALDSFHGGLLFFHFFGVDQDSHMLWRKFDADLLDTYRRVDAAIGEVRSRAPHATLVVMSDHGFAEFNRAMNLNTWLLSQGYLRLRRPLSEDAHDLLANADLNGSRAYAMGLNSLYLTHTDSGVRDEIAERLRAYRDPETGAVVVTATFAPDARGDYVPDLIVGYAPGYRGSWDAALGGIGRAIIEDNQDEWIGDHCIDPRFVPGVLLSDRRMGLANPSLQSLPQWIVARFERSGFE